MIIALMVGGFVISLLFTFMVGGSLFELATRPGSTSKGMLYLSLSILAILVGTLGMVLFAGGIVVNV